MPHHYSSASGMPIYGGRSAPVVLPLWAQNAGAAVNKLVAIPNSSLRSSTDTAVQSAAVQAYSGIQSKRDTNEIFSIIPGGHTDSAWNGVISFGPKGVGLMADSPQWILRCTPTVNPQPASDPGYGQTGINMYQADGKPTARHTYDQIHYSASAGRFVVLGGRGICDLGSPNSTASPPDDYYNIYMYDPVADAWDAPITKGNSGFDGGVDGYGIGVDHVTGEIYTNGWQKYNPVTKTFGPSRTSGANAPQGIRYPFVVAHDLGYGICMMFGNGYSTDTAGDGLNATKVNLTTGVSSVLTFNASQDYTDFLADASAAGSMTPLGAGMDYDDANQNFLLYVGVAGMVGRFYRVIPRGENPWDIAHVNLTADSVSLASIQDMRAGPAGRVKYIPGLKGFVVWPTIDSPAYLDNPMYFLKTA